MHSLPNSRADEAFRGYNRLHIQHHAETNRDMTMKEDFNPHGIYFSYKTTLGATAASVASLAAVILGFGIKGISAPEVMAASVGMAVIHGIFWARLHSDSHEVKLEYSDGLPTPFGIPMDYSKGPLAWLLVNHVGHHDINAVGNFNIVLPGADHVFGTYWEKKEKKAA
jgi:sterol desaturase/sphingolipid hydroxylase (fatty acid hydroxylase superfamily)